MGFRCSLCLAPPSYLHSEWLRAVVKADGYGHGIAETARAAVAGGATRLAVVTVEEAAEVSKP